MILTKLGINHHAIPKNSYHLHERPTRVSPEIERRNIISALILAIMGRSFNKSGKISFMWMLLFYAC